MLTPKQENFCLNYLETGNATEAYRRAYNAGRMKPATVHRKAKALLDNGKIAARLEELREPVRDAALVTLGGHLRDLERIRDGALEAKQFGPAAKAEELRAKACGVYEGRARFKIHDALGDTGRGLLKAVGDGQVTPNQGGKLLSALGSLARVIEVDELLNRVAALEAGQRGAATGRADNAPSTREEP